MITRKENEGRHGSSLTSSDNDKDRKYSDTGRDGDYTTGTPTSMEEGDEDYDDEMEELKTNGDRDDED